MENKIINIDIEQFNPYIRYANRTEGAMQENHIMPWRILYDFEMIFVTKGILTVKTKEKTYDINEGCLHLMPPFVEHTRTVPKNVLTNYFGVHFDFMFDISTANFSAYKIYQEPCEKKIKNSPVLEDLVSRNIYKPNTIDAFENFSVRNISCFIELFNNLYEGFISNNYEGRLNTKANMILIISKLFNEFSKRENENDRYENIVAKFIDFTMNHYSELVNLNEIVSEYGLSPSRFRSIFKQKTNKAPHEFLINYRMEQAKKLLLLKKYTISEVSYMVGYDDIHYFSKLFKQRENMTPTEFINQLTL